LLASQFFPGFFLKEVILIMTYRAELEEGLKSWVLQMLRQGYSVESIAEAMMSQKVKLMQTSEYIVAMNDAGRAP
jgi:transposase-like protein